MVSQAITFFIAGFETTSNALAFALYELCLRPDCQDQLRNEINDTFHAEGDITFDNIQKMKYLDMVLSGKFKKYTYYSIFLITSPIFQSDNGTKTRRFETFLITNC